MKISQSKPKRAANGRRPDRKAPVNGVYGDLFPAPSHQNVIQWPTQRQIHEVSTRLAKISRMGIRWEASGDYFNSGDLAYQLQEILRATSDLFKKIKRRER